MDKLKRIYDTFVSSGRFISATPYGSGHINDTYLVKVDEDVEYILQRINGNVFKDIPKLVRNKELVCGHIRNRLIRHKVSDITRKYITYFYGQRKRLLQGLRGELLDVITLYQRIKELRCYPGFPDRLSSGYRVRRIREPDFRF